MKHLSLLRKGLFISLERELKPLIGYAIEQLISLMIGCLLIIMIFGLIVGAGSITGVLSPFLVVLELPNWLVLVCRAWFVLLILLLLATYVAHCCKIAQENKGASDELSA